VPILRRGRISPLYSGGNGELRAVVRRRAGVLSAGRRVYGVDATLALSVLLSAACCDGENMFIPDSLQVALALCALAALFADPVTDWRGKMIGAAGGGGVFFFFFFLSLERTRPAENELFRPDRDKRAKHAETDGNERIFPSEQQPRARHQLDVSESQPFAPEHRERDQIKKQKKSSARFRRALRACRDRGEKVRFPQGVFSL